MVSGFAIGFALDRLWYEMQGKAGESKESDLKSLAALLEESQIPYALIGGVALQLYRSEPRTTLDIDVAVRDYAELPNAALLQMGFIKLGRYPYSENWRGPGGTPVQFSVDAAMEASLARAEARALGEVQIRVLSKPDLFRAKLRAASDPSRRRSKQLQDMADLADLLENDPSLETMLDEEELALVREMLG